MAVEYGKGIQKRIRGLRWTFEHVNQKVAAVINAVAKKEQAGGKSLTFGFSEILPDCVEQLERLGILAVLTRVGRDGPQEPGDLDWHWDLLHNPQGDTHAAYKWEVSWQNLIEEEE